MAQALARAAEEARRSLQPFRCRRCRLDHTGVRPLVTPCEPCGARQSLAARMRCE
jgi:hypothetical protein